MKAFETPRISLLKLDMEDLMTASRPCSTEIVACTACYCAAVQCPNGWVCDGLECATLSDFD